MELFNPRLGALLRSFSTDPLTARLGADDLRSMDEQAFREKEDMKQAEGLKQGMFLKLLQTGIENGMDEGTLQKFATGAGIDGEGLKLGGIGKNDPLTKRQEKAPTLAKDFDPASVDTWVQSGRYSDLKPLAKVEKPTILRPQDVAVDANGNVIAENKNVRPTKPTAAGYKQQRRDQILNDVETQRQSLQGSPKLSDRLKLAYLKIQEGQANDVYGTAEAAQRRKALDSRRDTLVNFDNAATRMTDILEKNPTAATVGADAAKAGLSALTQVKGLFNLIPGADLTDVDLDETDWTDQLNQIAGDNAELRSTMFSIAMMTAAADGLAGGRLTNQMVSQALENVGAGGRTPKALKRKLAEARRRVADALETTLSGELGDFSAVDRPDPTQAKPAQTGPGVGVVEDGYQFMGGDPKDKNNWRKL